MTTKESIIYESLKLFSVYGYDAVSTRMIARTVNASDAVIYKHFKNKQEIFDTIVNICREKICLKQAEVEFENLGWEAVEDVSMDRYEFQTTDEWVVMFRKLLLIEQFKNPEMGRLYREIFIDYPVKRLEELFKALIDKGYMKEGNPSVYAVELYAPFALYFTYEENQEEIKKNLREHAVTFRKNVFVGGEND